MLRGNILRKEVGRGLVSTGASVDTLEQCLEDNIEKHGGRLITATRNNTDNTSINRTKITRKQKWEEKWLYGHFKWKTSDIWQEKTWMWLKKETLREKSLQIAAQNNAINTNHIKARINKTQQKSKCRLCCDRNEKINHIISDCFKIAQK